MGKNPRGKWLAYRRINIIIMKIIGSHFMEPGFKLQLISWIPLGLVLNYSILLIYTLYYYRNEPFKALQATPAAGLIIPVN